MRPCPLLAFLLLAGCSAHRREARQVRKEEVRLVETAQTWWDDMRWDRVDTAALAIEDLTARGEFINSRMSGAGFRIVDVTLLGFEVTDPKLASETDAHLRDGRVLVRVEGYDSATQVVQSHTVTQTWYRTREGWYLAPGSELP